MPWCKVCEKVIKDPLNLHYSEVHFHNELRNEVGETSICRFCGYESLELWHHLGTAHGGYKPYLERVLGCYVPLKRYEIHQGLKVSCRLCFKEFEKIKDFLVHLSEEELREEGELMGLESVGVDEYSYCHECSEKVPGGTRGLYEHKAVLHQSIIKPYILKVNKSSIASNKFFTPQPSGSFKCLECETESPSEYGALDHVLFFHDPILRAPIYCLLCRSSVKSSFISHLIRIHFPLESPVLHGPPPFPCSVCSFLSNSKNQLLNHLYYLHNVPLNLYNKSVNQRIKLKEISRCWFCELEFENHLDIRIHLVEEHLSKRIESYLRSRIPPRMNSACPNCKFVALNFAELALHCGKKHDEYLENVLSTIDSMDMLKPICRTDPLSLKARSLKKMLHGPKILRGNYHKRLSREICFSTLKKKSFNEKVLRDSSCHLSGSSTLRQLRALPRTIDLPFVYEQNTTSNLPPPSNISNYFIKSPSPIVKSNARQTFIINDAITQKPSSSISYLQCNPDNHKNKFSLSTAESISTQSVKLVTEREPHMLIFDKTKNQTDDHDNSPIKSKYFSCQMEVHEQRKYSSNDENNSPNPDTNNTWLRQGFSNGMKYMFTRLELLKRCELDPYCFICGWKSKKVNLFYRHLLVDHFSKDVLKILNDLKDSKCPKCRMDCNTKDSMITHFAVIHRKVLQPYYTWVCANPEKVKSTIQRSEDLHYLSRLSLVSDKSSSFDINDDSGLRDGSEESLKVKTLVDWYKSEESAKGKSFIQPGACFYISKSLPYCHECEKYASGATNFVWSCCQFEGFRKLAIKNEQVIPVGWLDPSSDPKKEDCNLWTAFDDHLVERPSFETCKFILKFVGRQFCQLVQEELTAQASYPTERIWKRMQEGVREMCDVCSTTLFNTHYTCGDCGILICIDCFKMRLKGKYEYFGLNSLSKSLKSRRKILMKNRDEHMWPLCKGRFKHKTQNLLCTQIICNDLMETLYKSYHIICKKLGLQNCCQVNKQSDNKLKFQEEEKDFCEIKTSLDDPKQLDLSLLKECPVCYASFLPNVKILGLIHLTKHFKSFIKAYCKNENICILCDKTFENEDFAILHIGIDHGKTLEKLLAWYKYQSTGVKLEIDYVSSCVLCGTDFNRHWMGPLLIREHLFGHFYSFIRYAFNLMNGYCPLCPKVKTRETKKLVWLAYHIGIQHGYLDILWRKVMKDQKCLNNKKTTKSCIKIRRDDIFAFPCEICGERFPNQKAFFRHSILHFQFDLRQYISISDQCLLCSKSLLNCNPSLHVAFDHGKINELLNDPHKIIKKWRSVDLASFAFCFVCKTEGSYSLWHFALHYVVPSHRKIISQHPSMKEYISIISYFCIFCGAKLHSEEYYHHYFLHFKPFLNLCWDEGNCFLCEKLQSFKNSNDWEIHYEKFHFPQVLRDKFTNLSSLSDVKALCKSLFDLESIFKNNQPTVSITMRSSDTELKNACNFCNEGFFKGRYYEHVALKHFRETLAVGLTCSSPYLCNQCSFLGNNYEDLIVHSANYHKNLDRILNQIFPSFQSRTEEGDLLYNDYTTTNLSNFKNAKKDVLTCNVCNFKTTMEIEMNSHISHHIRMVTTYFANKNKIPLICLECRHETSSYISLLRHFFSSHKNFNEKKRIISFASQTRRTNIYEHEFSRKTVEKEFVFKKDVTTLELTLCNSGICFDKYFTVKKFDKIKSVVYDIVKENVIFPSWKLEDVSFVIRNKRSETYSESRDSFIMSKTTSSIVYPNIDHDWLCDGRLLVMNDPLNPKNFQLFQEQWKRGQPIIVANSASCLSKKFWHPKSFLNDFGHIRHDLINCFSGKTVPKAPLQDFWKGFENVNKRLKDSGGNPMLLKLKDWPPTQDIADYIPKRFNEFMNSLILPQYTRREGYLNLASYIPNFFLRPELGPKMYIAYGSALYSDKGSTNLHLDMSDAVNVLVHVGFPKDCDEVENAKEVFKEVDEADCDVLTKWRIRDKNSLPGALWHIYHPSDTGKIRAFLNKVGQEKFKRLYPHDDPIHDQSYYLDGSLRLRLYKEYGVKGYGIVQCAGDTVFIPAGACHQVRNLHNCIKVAEDFVSPENISHCLHLTQEFRHLTDFHTNHEDKLQIKNLMFHSIKTVIAAIKKHLKEEHIE